MASTLSARGRASLEPPPEYLQRSFEARANAYDESTNPEGTVDLSVAENRLSLPLVASALAAAAARSPPPPSELVYGDMHGRLRLRRALARLFTTHLVGTEVDADNLAVTSGAGSVLDLLAMSCCDAGDRVLVTAPGYKGFENDFAARAACTVAVAELDAASAFRVSAESLQRGWEAAGGESSRIKMVVIASPNNPTGEILSRERVRAIASWAREKGLHLVMDEIYGMSCHSAEGDDDRFSSVVEVLGGELGDQVHVVWSFSKDFCISGSRVGVLLTKNEALLDVFRGKTYFSSPSANIQWTIAEMLEDEPWVDEYIVENNRRLSIAYSRATAALREMGIPFVPAKAGFFVCVDLRQWMYEMSQRAEYELWLKLCDAGVLLTPSSQMFSSSYGWFRCCFAAVSERAAECGWRRVRKVLASV